MKEGLVSEDLLYVKKSKVHGYGVFAKKDIPSNFIIEECPVVHIYSIPFYQITKEIKDYIFNWDPSANRSHPVMVLGYGAVYNHDDNNSVYYYPDKDKNVMVYRTLREIKKGEEIFVSYGQEYFKALNISKKN